MAKFGVIMGFILLTVIITAGWFVWRLPRNVDDHVCRELSDGEVRPMLQRITGRSLPDNVEELRAITFGYSGIEELYLAFRTDQDGCAYILRQFGEQPAKRHEFLRPENVPWEWVHPFERAYQFQKRVGVPLFDATLIAKVENDQLEWLGTWKYPKDALTGYYLAFYAKLQPKSVYYDVLIFENPIRVYIAAGRTPEGIYLR